MPRGRSDLQAKLHREKYNSAHIERSSLYLCSRPSVHYIQSAASFKLQSNSSSRARYFACCPESVTLTTFNSRSYWLLHRTRCCANPRAHEQRILTELMSAASAFTVFSGCVAHGPNTWTHLPEPSALLVSGAFITDSVELFTAAEWPKREGESVSLSTQ